MRHCERRERGTELCSRLAKRVAEIAPAGIGRWDRAWDIVAEPGAKFIVALTAWEAEPSSVTKERIRITYNNVLRAWRRAVAEYESERAGR